MTCWDKHVPLKTGTVTLHHATLWDNDQIPHAKIDRRKCEICWQAKKTSYFTGLVEECENTLFLVVHVDEI